MEEQLFEEALGAARDTRLVAAEGGIRHRAASEFASLFGSQPAVVVTDQNTFEVARRDVQASFRLAGHESVEPFVFGPHVYADY